jgi:translin
MSSLDLSDVEQWARAELDARNAAREDALRRARDLIRLCATSIRAVHRREFTRAQELIEQATALNDAIRSATGATGDIYWAGYVQDAQKELVEACATYALIQGNPLPRPEEHGIAPAAYLNGLAEAVGELRRYLLDMLRRGETRDGERLLQAMDDIYSLLVTMDYPDALTGGLRRSTDNARGILEKTRGDLTLALRQDSLRQALEAARGRDAI